MKALSEVGIRKAVRFVFYTFYSLLIDLVLFSPFKIILLRLAGARIGNNVVINKVRFVNLHHQGFSTLRVGNYCVICDEVMLDLAGEIILEDHVTLSSRSFVLTHTNVGYKDHPIQKHYPKTYKRVVIKKGSFIGIAAIIMLGVTVGEEVVVGAGAVVTKNIPNKAVVVGSPAKVIKKLR